MTEDRQVADFVWDLLAQLGYADGRGGAEYRRELATSESVADYAASGYWLARQIRELRERGDS